MVSVLDADIRCCCMVRLSRLLETVNNVDALVAKAG